MRGTVQGRRIQESTGEVSRKRAEAVAIDREREVFEHCVLGIEAPATFAEAALSYMDRTDNTRFLHQIIAQIGKTQIHKVDQKKIDELARTLYPGCAASTLVRQLYTPVIAVLNDASRSGLCGRPSIRKPKVKKTSVKPATDDYINKLLEECNPRLKAFVLFMTYSGARVSEVCRMQPEHFNLQEGWAHIDRTKNGAARMVPLPPKVVAAIANILPEKGQAFGYKSRSSIDSALRGAAERAKLPFMSAHKIGRHAFAARLLASGADIKTVKEAGDWKSIKIVDESYGHLEISQVHEAMLKAAES